jgi:hypothetical protein
VAARPQSATTVNIDKMINQDNYHKLSISESQSTLCKSIIKTRQTKRPHTAHVKSKVLTIDKITLTSKYNTNKTINIVLKQKPVKVLKYLEKLESEELSQFVLPPT